MKTVKYQISNAEDGRTVNLRAMQSTMELDDHPYLVDIDDFVITTGSDHDLMSLLRIGYVLGRMMAACCETGESFRFELVESEDVGGFERGYFVGSCVGVIESQMTKDDILMLMGIEIVECRETQSLVIRRVQKTTLH